MDKQKLKKLLKPLVKECIQEALLEGGILSGIISEVVSGMNRAPVITESARPQFAHEDAHEQERRLEERRADAERHRQERIRALNESTSQKFGGVNIFEGTTPTKADRGASNSHGAPGALSGVDPDDPGVDISGLQALVGGHWNKLGKKR